MSAAEPSSPPPHDAAFAAAAVLPILLGAAAAWLGGPSWAERAAIVWAGAVLVFLAGVRRGLLFRAAVPDRTSGLLSALGLFAAALPALFAPHYPVAIMLLAIGWAALPVLDARAGRSGDAPPFLRPLRFAQAAVAVPSLLALALPSWALALLGD